MFEARLKEAALLKRLLDCELLYIAVFSSISLDTYVTFLLAVKELVTDANFECNEEGIVSQTVSSAEICC